MKPAPPAHDRVRLEITMDRTMSEQLREAAAREHRSATGQVRAILGKHLESVQRHDGEESRG